MERLNYAAILLLVFGIIEVYSYPHNSNAQNGAVSVESRPESFEAPSNDYLFLDDDEPYGMRKDPFYQVNDRKKRSPGGPKNTDDKLSRLKEALRVSESSPRVLTNLTPEQRGRYELRTEFERIVSGLIERYQLSRNEAIERAMRGNHRLAEELIAAHGYARV